MKHGWNNNRQVIKVITEVRGERPSASGTATLAATDDERPRTQHVHRDTANVTCPACYVLNPNVRCGCTSHAILLG